MSLAAGRYNFPAMNKLPFLILMLAVFTAACTSKSTLPPELVGAVGAAPATPTPAPSLTAPATFTPLPTDTPAPTATSALEPSPTNTPTTTVTPTYAILRGTVLQRANCRYGAGWAYLYKYGLLIGNYLEVIGRNDDGTWAQVRAIGGDNPCWVRADLMDIEGDILAVAPVENKLPFSPYYGPLSGVWSERVPGKNEVLISWNEMRLRPGDDSEQYLYLVEAWTCQNGEIVFQAIGLNENQLRIIDEPGCAEESHARVYGVEKHGYTLWMKVPWPDR
jgi:hypothetical protein